MTAHDAKVDRCWHCGQPMWIWQPLDVDHVKARSLGGKAGPYVLAHALQPLSGATLGNGIRGARHRAAKAAAQARRRMLVNCRLGVRAS